MTSVSRTYDIFTDNHFTDNQPFHRQPSMGSRKIHEKRVQRRKQTVSQLGRFHLSRKIYEKRVQRLRDEGVTDAEMERVRAPIGLDISGRTPEETAVSIFVEDMAHFVEVSALH